MYKEKFDRKKVYIVSGVSFLLGFIDTFWIYTLSTYLSDIAGTDNVGAFYLIAFTGVLISLFYLQPLIRRIGRARMLYFSLGLAILLSALLTHIPASWFAVVIVMFFIIANNIIWVSLDILLEGFSSDGMAGRIRGLHLTVLNAGVLVAPFLASKVLNNFHFEGIFFVMSVGYMIIFLISLISFRNDNMIFQESLKPWQTWRKMMREKNLFYIYCISFAMDFFYALMIVFTPLYLLNLGFSWDQIGIIFTVMLIPFVLLEYPLGMIADRRLGEKELLIVSIMIVIFSTSLLPFIDSQNVWVWAGALFLTRVGIAGIEVLRDAYFYKQIDGNDSDVIAFFRTSRPVANIVGAGIAALALLFWPMKSVFFIIVVVMILALVATIFLEDTESEQELAG